LLSRAGVTEYPWDKQRFFFFLLAFEKEYIRLHGKIEKVRAYFRSHVDVVALLCFLDILPLLLAYILSINHRSRQPSESCLVLRLTLIELL
jgi:hypothetical protein